MSMALRGAEALIPFITRALVSGAGVDGAIQRDCQAAWHRRFDRRIRLCRLLHHALLNPALIDVASSLGAFPPRLLNACFRQTRDPEWTTP
jgi:hypothetical protein